MGTQISSDGRLLLGGTVHVMAGPGAAGSTVAEIAGFQVGLFQDRRLVCWYEQLTDAPDPADWGL